MLKYMGSCKEVARLSSKALDSKLTIAEKLGMKFHVLIHSVPEFAPRVGTRGCRKSLLRSSGVCFEQRVCFERRFRFEFVILNVIVKPRGHRPACLYR